MASNPLIFKNAKKVRDSITESQKKEIAKLYNDWADEIGKMADYYAKKTTASAPVSERYYRELKKQLQETSHQVSNEVYKNIKNNMYIVSDSVVSDNVNWLKQFGFSEDGLNAAFSYVPDSTVRAIVTGQVYESGWSLSQRIWGNNEQTMQDLYRIVAGGVAQQMPIYDISKQLEQYVRPGAAKQWNLIDKDGRKIYPRQVDYNAQRLARTLVQHSYQQSFVAVTQKNPFVEDYIWIANGSRVCELCKERDGKHFKKDNLPLDHPNGMCVMEPNVDDNMTDKLAEWFNSEDGTFPEIDEFAKNFGYESNKSTAKQRKTSTTKTKDVARKSKSGTSVLDESKYSNLIEVKRKTDKEVIEEWKNLMAKQNQTSEELNLVNNGYFGTVKSNSINRALRENPVTEISNIPANKFGIINGEENKKTAVALESLISKNHLKQDTILTRREGEMFIENVLGLKSENLKSIINDFSSKESQEVLTSLIGTEVKSGGFLSTSGTDSRKWGFYNSGVRMEIYAPEGTNAFIGNPGELEVVLGRNASYKIVGFEAGYNSKKKIDEVVFKCVLT